MVRLYYREVQTGADSVLAAHALLEQALDIAPDVLQYDGAGIPFVPGGPCVSLSHTGGAAAAAVSGTPVGVDVEKIRPVRPGLARRVMSGAEYRWFLSQGQKSEDFFTLWTLKESYYKFLGTGLPGFPNNTEFYREGGAWRLRGADHSFFVYRKKELLIALCSDEQQVQAFSESSD